MPITRNFTLYLNAGISVAPTVHVNQYDRGEQWVFTLLDDKGQKYTPSSGALIGVKADGNAIAGVTGTVGSNGDVYITETQQMTAAAGKAIFELTIDGQTHGTANFIVQVEKKPTDDAVLSESDLSIIQQGIDSVTPAAINETVSEYLAEHMTNPPIDPTLTVSNAAADAKVTGDKITDLKNALNEKADRQNLENISETETIETSLVSVTINENTLQYVNRGANKGLIIPCTPNTAYHIVKTDGDKFLIGYIKTAIQEGATLYGYENHGTTGTIDYVTGNDATYFIVMCNIYGTFTTNDIVITCVTSAVDRTARQGVDAINAELPEYEKAEMFTKLNQYTRQASANLLNYPDAQMDKDVNPTTGVISDHANYWASGFCEVEAGTTIYYFTRALSQTNFRFLAAYDENKNVLPGKGVDSASNSYTVPTGVKYIVISSTYATSWTYWKPEDFMLTVDANPTKYVDYIPEATYYLATDEFLSGTSSITEQGFRDEYMDEKPRNMLDPDECTIGQFIPASGVLSANESYWSSGYIPVKSGQTIKLYNMGLARTAMRFVCAYNSAKTAVTSAGSNSEVRSYTVPDGIAYVVISINYYTGWTYYLPKHFMLTTVMPTEFLPYSSETEYVFKEKYIPGGISGENLHVYLPPEICVGIGRTIELYNDLVCLEANKYHLHYSCSVGVQYARKFSITGTTAGTYTLSLQIFNDEKQMVWYGTSSVKIVANSITNQLKIVPIGDSLTNLKPWLSEVQSLSDSKILYIGTRGRSDNQIRHEGRSGFSAEDYNANTEYTFDGNYQGSSGISGTVNPFWDVTNNKFSLAYYINTQGATVGTPDAVQLFLGTNDVFGGASAGESAGYITDLIDAIRAEYPNMPVFVCNTIYRSDQNGYYSSGGQGFTSASGWAFDSDLKIMELQNALKLAIAQKNYTNVFTVPLSVCMDRDYDFGQVEVSVNPRLQDVTVNIPSESVHPQNAGYMQMADVMYSSYIAHLS